MNQAFFSFIAGLFYTGGLFLLSLFSVVGAKVLLKRLFAPNAAKIKSEEKPKSPPKPVKQNKTIEINTDEVDKIYFKKSS